MLYAYVDESEYNNDFYFLSALIFTDEKEQQLDRKIKGILQGFISNPGITLASDVELHAYDMMQNKRQWKKVPLSAGITIYRQYLQAVNHYAEALYIEGIDRQKVLQRYPIPWDSREIAIQYILERINEHAEKQDERVTVIFDDHHTKKESHKAFKQYQSYGTFGYRSSKLDHIDAIDFKNSKQYIGLQTSDLCCYIFNRVTNSHSSSPKIIKTQNQLWDSLTRVRQEGRVRIWP